MVRSRRRGLRRALGERVVVHTTDDRTLDGILVGDWVDAIALAHCTLLQPGDRADVPLGGDVLIPRTSVALVQVSP